MTSAEAISTSHPALSLKAACFGFIASTVALTALMVLVGNLT